MRLLLAREWAHATDPTKFRLDLTSIRSDFEPIKKWSNRAETWQEQSLPHMEATVKIWLHLDLWFRRYDRFEMEISWLAVCFEPIISKPGARTHVRTCFCSDVARTPRVDPDLSPS